MKHLSLARWQRNGLQRLDPQAFLPLTGALITLLIVLPALQLHRFPRSNAAGLQRLLTASALIQSFAADPRRAAPPLWVQRLGPGLAQQLWTRQRGYWWQFWSRDGDGTEAFLALPARAFGVGSSAPLPPNGLRLDDLVVIAADPLARQGLLQSLRRQLRSPRGLQERCVERLRTGQSVAWSSQAINQLAGPLAPLLQRFQEGCLKLSSDGLALLWQGEARTSSERIGGRLPQAVAVDPLPPSPAGANLEPGRGLPASLLLEVRGDRLDLLAEALLSRRLIRQPLAERYGLPATLADHLLTIPFELRLRPLPRGPFQASLELQLVVGKERRAWQAWLPSLEKALLAQGLKQHAKPPSAGSPASALPSSRTWVREDGTVVGGWRWISAQRGGSADLEFFLGPEPPPATAAATSGPAGSVAVLRLRARPAALEAANLLPQDLPAVVRRAEQLEMVSVSRTRQATEPAGDPVSGLSGSLLLEQTSTARIRGR